MELRSGTPLHTKSSPQSNLTPAGKKRQWFAVMRPQFGNACRPVVEADSVGARYAPLTSRELATIASTAWLPASVSRRDWRFVP
jgi:hypothetical protein